MHLPRLSQAHLARPPAEQFRSFTADVIRVYLPPDASTLLPLTDHCLRSRNYVNVIVAGKQPELRWLDMDAAVKHCAAGLGVWKWAGNDRGRAPDVVMACAADVPPLETLAMRLVKDVIERGPNPGSRGAQLTEIIDAPRAATRYAGPIGSHGIE